MEERKEDPRIYVVSILFLSCIVGGGVLLGLYIFLPPNDAKPWYPIAGLILVGIPWAFWFLTYIYRCIRPQYISTQRGISFKSSPSANMEGAAAPEPGKSLSDEESALESPHDEARRVHFGGVVVISEDQSNSGDQGCCHHDDDRHASDSPTSSSSGGRYNSVNSRESEMPLTLAAHSR